MDLVTLIRDGLGAAGGGLALGFIVALAIGMIAMALIYVGSAVIVLDRFARVARNPAWVAFFGAVVSALAAAAYLSESRPELSLAGWSEWGRAYGQTAGGIWAISLLLSGVTWLVLRASSANSGRLGGAVLALLGIAFGAMVGAAGEVAHAFVPPLAVAPLGAALTWRRRRRAPESEGPSEGERGIWMLCLGSASGIGVALLYPLGADLAGTVGAGAIAGVGVLTLFGLLPLAAAGLVGMRRSVEWFIALRYLVAKRRQVFISAITAICVAGVAAGVWLIIVVLSVMNGFEQTWRQEILGNRAHFTLHSGFGQIEDVDDVIDQVRHAPGVVAASPFLDVDGMVRGRQGEIFSVRIRGVDPETVGSVTSLDEDMLHGSLSALEPAEVAEGADPVSEAPGIIIGHHLARGLAVDVGDEMVLISPFGGPPTPLGPGPRLARFRVAGVFQSSFHQFDEVYTYVALGAAQEFRRSGPVVDGIECLTTDYYRSRRVGDAVAEALGYPFFARDWKDYYPAFFQALKTERVMMFLLLTMIMVVAAFVIVTTLIMMIMEKSSDISILKAMGAQDSLVERIFALEGTFIGLAGTTLGVLAGIAVTSRLSWIQDRIEALTGIDTLPASVYQFSELPSKVDPVQVGLVVLIAMILSLGATLLPSRQGARLDPAEGLRHE